MMLITNNLLTIKTLCLIIVSTVVPLLALTQTACENIADLYDVESDISNEVYQLLAQLTEYSKSIDLYYNYLNLLRDKLDNLDLDSLRPWDVRTLYYNLNSCLLAIDQQVNLMSIILEIIGTYDINDNNLLELLDQVRSRHESHKDMAISLVESLRYIEDLLLQRHLLHGIAPDFFCVL